MADFYSDFSSFMIEKQYPQMANSVPKIVCSTKSGVCSTNFKSVFKLNLYNNILYNFIASHFFNNLMIF